MGYHRKSYEDTGGKSALSPIWRKGVGVEVLEKGWVKSKGSEEKTQ